MADNSLDDFFAKKDKTRRSKNKGKYAAPEQLPKKLEEGMKKIERINKKEKESGTTPSTINAPTQEHTQEEWNEVNDEEKDYSGLRLQALTIDKDKEEEQMKDQLSQEDGDEAHSNEGPQGPWKKSNASTSADADSPESEKEDEDEQEEEAPPVAPPPPQEELVKSKYVPPSKRAEMARGGDGGSTRSHGPIGRRYHKSVPEMTSEEHFPSLSSAIDPSPKGARSQLNDKSFQSVKHGSRYKDDLSQSGVHLDLENKYAALRRRDN